MSHLLLLNQITKGCGTISIAIHGNTARSIILYIAFLDAEKALPPAYAVCHVYIAAKPGTWEIRALGKIRNVAGDTVDQRSTLSALPLFLIWTISRRTPNSRRPTCCSAEDIFLVSYNKADLE